MQVTQYHRYRAPTHFSIERVFADIRRGLPSDVTTHTATSRFPSRGVLPRLYNTIDAVFRQGEVNHITGDVHHLAIFLQKRRTLLTIHDCQHLERLRGLRRLLYFIFWFWIPVRRAALISTVSETTRQHVLSQVACDPRKVRVIHNPVSSDFKPVPSEFRAHYPRILQIGTGINKNLPRVAEALAGIPCHFRIIGRLSAQQVHSLTNTRIDFSSAAGLSDMEIVAEYRECDMVVFASTYEGFGLPIVEANAVGRPVVTSNLLSMPEIAGAAACLVDPYDVESIRQGVLRVIRDADYRRSLIDAGFQNVHRFRPETIAAQYAELYRELSAPRVGDRPVKRAPTTDLGRRAA